MKYAIPNCNIPAATKCCSCPYFSELINAYKTYFYAGQQDLYDDIDRGVRYYPFSVTRLDECPSVLIELGFMTNDAECYRLTVEQNQQILGQAIAKGICDTLVG